MSFALYLTHGIEQQEPQSFEGAMICPDSIEWNKVIKSEMNSLVKNKTRTLVERSPNQKVVECTWLFKIKEGITMEEKKKFKALLVAKGFTQRKGVDYIEAFSPVVKYKTIILILAFVAQFDWELE